jgi:uncharacterized protein (TIGR00661 family)
MSKQSFSRKRILIAPMDWGLGHATRCIPIIEELIKQDAEVILAGSGRSLALLRNRYPDWESLELPGYRVKYSRGKRQIWKIMTQIPRLIGVIREENKLVQSWIKKYQINGIISDNRYGVWADQIPSIFVGHQLSPALPGTMSWLRHSVFRAQMRWLKPFQEIWIPDFEGENNLSGDLSHLTNQPEKTRFLGPLSRFQFIEEISRTRLENELKDLPEILVLLSGPEPQRSILEKIICEQGLELDQKIWIIQGKTEQNLIKTQKNITLISSLTSDKFYLALTKTPYIVSRSGYSSIMDYYTLGLKNVIMIPTPGQTEQEYLGEKMRQENWAWVCPQHQFNLAKALQNLNPVGFPDFPRSGKKLQQILGDFLARV